MTWLWLSLQHAGTMFWDTFWALVIGFAISAALRIFVSQEFMTRAFGKAGLREVFFATVLGAASSSCSFAAAAAGRSAFQKGAALVPMLAFMFASTNLVVELGALLWVLMGWHFVVAEILGAFVLIGAMWILTRLFFPADIEREARERARFAIPNGHCCGDHEHGSPEVASGPRLVRMADAFVADWKMLWKEIAIGFLVAGFLAATVPSSWWELLFLKNGPAALQHVANAFVGPLIAVLSFVCSCANIPMAAVLWMNGISFGGVISFIYADLIVIPLILIYRKYYGTRAALYIIAILYCSMVTAGIVIDLLFQVMGLVPSRDLAADAMHHEMMTMSYAGWLNGFALVIFLGFLIVHLTSRRTMNTAQTA